MEAAQYFLGNVLKSKFYCLEKKKNTEGYLVMQIHV